MVKERNAWTRAAYFIKKNKLPQLTLGEKRVYTLLDDPAIFERLTGAARPADFPERLILGESAQQVVVSLLGLTYLLQTQQYALLTDASLSGHLSLLRAAACMKFLSAQGQALADLRLPFLAQCLELQNESLVNAYLDLRG